MPHCSFALSNPLEIKLLAETIITTARQYLNMSSLQQQQQQQQQLQQQHNDNNNHHDNNNHNKSKEINIVIIQRYINESFYFYNKKFPYVDSFVVNNKSYDSGNKNMNFNFCCYCNF